MPSSSQLECHPYNLLLVATNDADDVPSRPLVANPCHARERTS
jgi:hypothetical protein